MKNAFSKFLGLIYLPGMGPEGGRWKKHKMAYNSAFPSFLVKNKHTFIKETFHFLPDSIFWFFVFFIFAPSYAFLGFRFFSKKPKNLKNPILPPKSKFRLKLNSWIKRNQKVILEKFPQIFKNHLGVKVIRGLFFIFLSFFQFLPPS